VKNRDAIRANERFRSISRTMFQLGAALLGAAVVKAYGAGGLTSETAGWCVGAASLIWVGWQVLGLLDSEDE
jgi:hypothetical protein